MKAGHTHSLVTVPLPLYVIESCKAYIICAEGERRGRHIVFTVVRSVLRHIVFIVRSEECCTVGVITHAHGTGRTNR